MQHLPDSSELPSVVGRRGMLVAFLDLRLL